MLCEAPHTGLRVLDEGRCLAALERSDEPLGLGGTMCRPAEVDGVAADDDEMGRSGRHAVVLGVAGHVDSRVVPKEGGLGEKRLKGRRART